MSEVQRRWASLLTYGVRLVIANVVSTDMCVGQFQRNSFISLSDSIFVVKE